jgi:hypothetical protein
MTKMLENGQLEFTFEELDFEGAYIELNKEMDKLMPVQAYIARLPLYSFPESTYEYFDKEFKRISDRLDILHCVNRYLINLKWGDNFVE